MADVVIDGSNGAKARTRIPHTHEWQEIRSAPEFLEVRCKVCGSTKMNSWGDDQQRKARLLGKLGIDPESWSPS